MFRPVGRLPPASRVRKHSEYQRVQSAARRVSTPHFVLLLHARGDDTGTRLGIIVTRKVGNAVVRSRAKRTIREAFRASRGLFGPDFDVVVIVKRWGEDLSSPSIAREWSDAAPAIQRRGAEARRDREARRGPSSDAPGGAGGKAQDS